MDHRLSPPHCPCRRRCCCFAAVVALREGRASADGRYGAVEARRGLGRGGGFGEERRQGRVLAAGDARCRELQQEGLLEGRQEQHGAALLPRARGAPDAVDVQLAVVGDAHLDDVRDSRVVHAPRGDVAREEDPRFVLRNRSLARSLAAWLFRLWISSTGSFRPSPAPPFFLRRFPRRCG